MVRISSRYGITGQLYPERRKLDNARFIRFIRLLRNKHIPTDEWRLNGNIKNTKGCEWRSEESVRNTAFDIYHQLIGTCWNRSYFITKLWDKRMSSGSIKCLSNRFFNINGLYYRRWVGSFRNVIYVHLIWLLLKTRLTLLSSSVSGHDALLFRRLSLSRLFSLSIQKLALFMCLSFWR